MIGWTPRYLVSDLTAAMTESPGGEVYNCGSSSYAAHVVRVNPPPSPMTQRVLVEMCGRWDKYEPMESEDFQPLVGD